MNTAKLTAMAVVAALALLLAGCATAPQAAEQHAASAQPQAGAAAASAPAVASAQPSGAQSAAQPAAIDPKRYEKPGFVVKLEKERLWVFRDGSKELAEFEKSGEPVKQVIRPAAGLGGMTLKAVDGDTLDEYLATVPGFVVKMDKGRLWVFRAGSKDLADFLASGEPVKQVIRPAAGPGGLTLKAVDGETLDAYLAAYRAM